jgi:hypothetical protein
MAHTDEDALRGKEREIKVVVALAMTCRTCWEEEQQQQQLQGWIKYAKER